MSSVPQTFVLMGRSGCGKGTQADLLLQYLKERDPRRPRLYLETGERFRALASKHTATSRLVASALAEGALLPDFLAVWNWTDLLVKKLKGSEHVVIDGAPRSKLEAQALDSAFQFYRRRPVTILWVDVGPAWARERLTARGRADDVPADIAERLAWFDREVRPAIHFFESDERYRVRRINGEQSIEAVHEEIVESL